MSPSKRFMPDGEDAPAEPQATIQEAAQASEPAQESAAAPSQPPDTVIQMTVNAMSDDEINERLRRSAEAKAQAAAESAAQAAAAQARVTHTVVPGDTLGGIAAQYYADAGRWPAIFEANRDVIGDNPNLILVGQELVIP
jgi:nucleoid-associated protein YgaU